MGFFYIQILISFIKKLPIIRLTFNLITYVGVNSFIVDTLMSGSVCQAVLVELSIHTDCLLIRSFYIFFRYLYVL